MALVKGGGDKELKPARKASGSQKQAKRRGQGSNADGPQTAVSEDGATVV